MDQRYQAARARIRLLDVAPPEEDVETLVQMLLAHELAFAAVRDLDLEGFDLSASFEAAWDA